MLAGAAAAAGSAFASLVVSGFKAADALGDAAERAGVSVESLSRLKFAAEQNDVEFSSLATAIKRWQVTLSEASTSADKAAGSVGLLHLNAADLKQLSLEDQLGRIADQFKRIQDPADRTRVAVELFGRAGEQLVPLLMQGSDGIKALTAEADKLGITLDEKTTRSVDKADKALKKLKATIDSFGSRVAGSIAEAIVGPVDNLDAAEQHLQKLLDERNALIGNLGGRIPSAQFDKLLADMDARIAGAKEGIEIVKRMEAEVASSAKNNPLVIPNKDTDKLLEQLEMIRVSESLLKDPIIAWEEQTRTSAEKISAEFDDFEAKLNQVIKAKSEALEIKALEGKISVPDATKAIDELANKSKERFNEKLDDILKPVETSVERLKVPLTAAQERAKAFTDTLVEGLSNAARAGETSGRAILRNLLAAFESKALMAAIQAVANAITKAIGGASGKSGVLGGLIGAIFGHAAGGGNMSGPRIVGEEGPELLLGGGQVMTRRQLAFASASHGANVSIGDTQIVVQGSGDPERTAQYVEARIQQNNRKQLEQISRIMQNNGYGALR